MIVDDILEQKAKMMADGYNPTLLVVSPDIWEEIITSQFFQSAPPGQVTQLFGMRVVVNNTLGKGKFLCSFEWDMGTIGEFLDDTYDPSKR